MTKEQLQWAMYEAYATQLLNRIEAQEAEIAKLGTMAEQARADAVTRAAADEKRIEALRYERDKWKVAYDDRCALLDVIHSSLGIEKGHNVIGEIDRLHKVRNGLLTQVQDLRAALAKEQELHAATALRMATDAAKMVERKPGAWIKTNDGRVLSVRGYLVRISPDREELYDGGICTPCDPPDQGERKHPVKAGEWVIRTDGDTDEGMYYRIGVIAQVLEIRDTPENQYRVSRPDWNGYSVPWAMRYCAPCDPPAADHDTPEGKDVAESGIRDGRKTEPADGIKVGDVAEVFQATGDITATSDIGLRGTVREIDSEDNSVRINSLAQNKDEWVDMCDVRKVTT